MQANKNAKPFGVDPRGLGYLICGANIAAVILGLVSGLIQGETQGLLWGLGIVGSINVLLLLLIWTSQWIKPLPVPVGSELHGRCQRVSLGHSITEWAMAFAFVFVAYAVVVALDKLRWAAEGGSVTELAQTAPLFLPLLAIIPAILMAAGFAIRMASYIAGCGHGKECSHIGAEA